jgi:NAD(P)-dependent dehydrogenase (short-subunit alcohol dehydrogenase family)
MAKRGAIVYRVDKKFVKTNNSSNMFSKICDITNNRKFDQICNSIFKKHNKIDILINNAGISLPNILHGIYPKKNWDETLAINLSAAFHASQTVIKYMAKRNKGSIINITSINAEFAFPNNPAYVASKGGLKLLGKALAKDWGRFGIRVNNLGPGYIKTEMTMKSFNDKDKRVARENSTMLGRWGEVKDLLGPCIFLASDASSYITGQDIYVDGGWSANGLHTKEN